jgi:transmembrane protein EpsG
MTILYLNLLIVFMLSFFARYFSLRFNTGLPFSLKPNKLLAIGTMASLILVSGLRSNIGDTYFYKHTYQISDFSWSYIQSQKDMGFGVFQKVLKNFSGDPQLLIFTTALITNVLIIMVLYKYSYIFELSTYVYITGGLFLVSMNGIREVLAAAIIFCGMKFILNGNWKKFIILDLFASSFHESALVLIPIYFIVRQKAWTKVTFLLISVSVLIVLGFNEFSKVLFSAIENTQYGNYADFKEGGANILRIAVDGVPIFIAFLGREKLRWIFPKIDYIVNMSIIGFIFMIISSQDWIFARFSIYFSLYELILISWILNVFREKDRKVIYYAIIVCYFAYYFYESVISLNIIYSSDYLHLN